MTLSQQDAGSGALRLRTCLSWSQVLRGTAATCAGLFSATQTEAVQALARAGLRNPVRINVAVAGVPTETVGAGAGVGQKTPSGLSIQYTVCGVEHKLPLLLHFLQVPPHPGLYPGL